VSARRLNRGFGHHPGSRLRPGTPSTLRMALNGWFCYTTVFNVIELFARAASRREERRLRTRSRA